MTSNDYGMGDDARISRAKRLKAKRQATAKAPRSRSDSES